MARETSNASATPSLDTKALSNLIYQLNIVRRQVSAYPPGHQVILSAADRTLKVLANLKTTTPQITIGIARDRLMLGATPLDPKNPVYREYARALFSHGIVALTIHLDLSAEELCTLCRLIARKPEDILAQGGIVAAATAANIIHAKVTPLAHNQFRTTGILQLNDNERATQSDTTKPWDRFVGTLLAPAHPPQAGPWPTEIIVTPEKLAGILSTEESDCLTKDTGEYDKAITTFLRDLDRENLSHHQHDELLDKFRIFVNELQPELRQQFLSSTVSMLGIHETQAGALLSRFPSTLLLDTLNDLNARQADIPPFILQMLSQLSCAGPALETAQTQKNPAGMESFTAEHFQQVFAEHRANDFVPEDYQSLLRGFPNQRPVPVLPPDVIEGLTESVHDQTMERRLCAIITHMMQHFEEPQCHAALKSHLSPLIQHFIDTGDFAALIDLHRQADSFTQASRTLAIDNLTASFSSYRFTREIVRSLSLWPQAKRQEIFELMLQVGAPFVPILLDQLGEEQDRSVRSRYLKLLGDMGPIIRQEVLSRLHDDRWHMVRNLIVLLRGLDDPELMDTMEPLLQHPHERVRQEALKTAFYFKDARADDALLKELKRTTDLPPAWAIGLARHSQDTRVFQRLVDLLRQTSLSNESLSMRLAVVATLADIGNPIALNALEQVLFSFSICHPRRHKRLQAQIMASLKNYPRESTKSLYRRLDHSVRPDLAELRHLSGPINRGTAS